MNLAGRKDPVASTTHCSVRSPTDHLHAGGARARVCLDCENLVVEVVVLEALGGPVRKVVGHGNSSRRTLARADREVLWKRCSARNRGLIDLRMLKFSLGMRDECPCGSVAYRAYLVAASIATQGA